MEVWLYEFELMYLAKGQQWLDALAAVKGKVTVTETQVALAKSDRRIEKLIAALEPGEKSVHNFVMTVLNCQAVFELVNETEDEESARYELCRLLERLEKDDF